MNLKSFQDVGLLGLKLTLLLGKEACESIPCMGCIEPVDNIFRDNVYTPLLEPGAATVCNSMILCLSSGEGQN